MAKPEYAIPPTFALAFVFFFHITNLTYCIQACRLQDDNKDKILLL